MTEQDEFYHMASDRIPLLSESPPITNYNVEGNPLYSKPAVQHKKGKSRWYMPQRYIIALLGFLGMVNVGAMRVNLSIAVLAMRNISSSSNISARDIDCPELVQNDTKNTGKVFKVDQYNWDSETTTHILESFFYGYIISQVPGGYLASHLSGKWLFGGGVFLTGIFTIVTPIVAKWGVNALMVDRILEGLAEGVTKPSMTAIISWWTPKYERSRISTFVFTGGQVGNVIALSLSGLLSSSEFFGGWPSIFYLFGICSLTWFIFWAFMMYDSPIEHPDITEEELQCFELNAETPHRNPKVPWKAIFTSLPVWAVAVAHFGYSLGFLTLFTVLPSYLKSALNVNIQMNGSLSAVPHACEAVTAWIAAHLADRLRESGKLSITTIRKIFNTIGVIGPAVFLMGVTVSGCRPRLIVTLVSLAMALNGFVYSGFHVTHVDMSPDFAGVLFGITNSIASVNGIIGPAIAETFTDKSATTENWNKVFYILCAVYVLTAIFFALFASAELQPWGLDKKATPITSLQSLETISVQNKDSRDVVNLKKVSSL